MPQPGRGAAASSAKVAFSAAAAKAALAKEAGYGGWMLRPRFYAAFT